MMDMVKSQRINRYIMECKLVKEPAQKSLRTRINRYIMECKYQRRRNCTGYCSLFPHQAPDRYRRDEGTVQDIADELIDILWNVNKKNSVLLRCGNGINRYIMECKWKAGHKGTYA